MAEALFESNWSATKEALLEGLQGSKKSTMDVILENAKVQLQESATAGSTMSGNIASLNKVMLPLIRRVMPSLIANELLGVQPMSGPVGQIHTLRVRYAESKDSVTAGQEALSPFALATAYSGSPDATASSEGTAGSKMSIQILKQTVEANPRRHRARWTFGECPRSQTHCTVLTLRQKSTCRHRKLRLKLDQEMLAKLRALAPTVDTLDSNSGIQVHKHILP